ncbi:hypothetical protein B0H10DRAFT_376220 [Mycena sp. CBHHK59/15]|nr:hypothetical protein B0H10DRAFT_376220 [Mycena sp. CBHHK59/15]
MLSTLNPALLMPHDRLDLAHRRSITLSFLDAPPVGSAVNLPKLAYTRTAPFPSHACGFFYLRPPAPGHPPPAASLRFRLATTPDPRAFEEGSDLHLPSGAPWQLLAGQIGAAGKYKRLRAQLLRESLVPRAALAKHPAFTACRVLPERTLFAPGDVFPVRFDTSLNLVVVRGKRVHALSLRIFQVERAGEVVFPFAGSALAHFEPAARPYFVHLRILAVVAPVTRLIPEYKGRIVQPAAGQLFRVRWGSRGLEALEGAQLGSTWISRSGEDWMGEDGKWAELEAEDGDVDRVKEEPDACARPWTYDVRRTPSMAAALGGFWEDA